LKRTVLAITILGLFLTGCLKEKPVPPEVSLAEKQEFDLWRAGAPVYLKEPFSGYREAFLKSKANLARVNAGFRWFRNYQPIQGEFAQLLKQGDELFKQLEIEKQKRASRILEQRSSLGEELNHLERVTLLIHPGKLSRTNLARAEVALNEARTLYEGGQYPASEAKLREVDLYLTNAEKVTTPVLNRYRDINQITKWRRWVRETVEQSREKDIYCILVIKANKKLLLYKDGKLLRSYPVGLGRNGWSDKLRAKDNATPEGKYRIIGKNPESRYHRALSINYPNEEDQREFYRAKKRGLLPKSAKIGGSIEIHGGGDEGLTYGCISLDNKQIEELYDAVDVGTPVTIIGALDERNRVSSAGAAIPSKRDQ
jgi:lipoprotein-anchoring transpeptidase ErfK/SrfK